jgi:hypothetical protein
MSHFNIENYKNVPLFKDIDDEGMNYLFEIANPIEYKTDEIIING